MSGLCGQPVAVVGAGQIVEFAHLPAYRALGIPVAGVWARDAARAAALAAQAPGARAYASLDELLADSRVRIVDVAVTAAAQPEIALRALRAGKHLLCQKPFATSLEPAREIVAEAAARGLRVAVNQNMRWEPTIEQVKARIEDGRLGRPVAAFVEVNVPGGWPPPEHWLAREPRMLGLYEAVHTLDAARFLFGEPARVTARAIADPRQQVAGDSWVAAWLEWDDGPFMTFSERWANAAGDVVATVRVEGTRGAVRGRMGNFDDYPNPVPHVVEAIDYADGRWQVVEAERSWIPEGFRGPVAELIHAIEEGREPSVSGADNLRTLALVEAVYRSSETLRTVAPA